MASRTVGEFAKNLNKLPKLAQNICLAKWERQTIGTTDQAKRFSPVLTGDLQGSGTHRRARKTTKGINSAIIFRQPYALELELGERKLKNGETITLNVSTKFNPNARTKYVSTAVDKTAKFFVKDASDCVGKAFLKV